MNGPDFNTEKNLHADKIAEQYDAEREEQFCECGKELKSEKEQRDRVCRECL